MHTSLCRQRVPVKNTHIQVYNAVEKRHEKTNNFLCLCLCLSCHSSASVKNKRWFLTFSQSCCYRKITLWLPHHLYSPLPLHLRPQWQMLPCSPDSKELQQHPPCSSFSAVLPPPLSPLPPPPSPPYLPNPQAASAVSMLSAVFLFAAAVKWWLRIWSCVRHTELWEVMLSEEQDGRSV